MAIVLFSHVETLRKQAKDFTDDKLPVLLTTGESVLAAPLQTVFED